MFKRTQDSQQALDRSSLDPETKLVMTENTQTVRIGRYISRYIGKESDIGNRESTIPVCD